MKRHQGYVRMCGGRGVKGKSVYLPFKFSVNDLKNEVCLNIVVPFFLTTYYFQSPILFYLINNFVILLHGLFKITLCITQNQIQLQRTENQNNRNLSERVDFSLLHRGPEISSLGLTLWLFLRFLGTKLFYPCYPTIHTACLSSSKSQTMELEDFPAQFDKEPSFWWQDHPFAGYLFVGLRQCLGVFLVLQWIRLRASTAEGVGSVPGQGTKIPHTKQHDQKIKRQYLGFPSSQL